MMASAIVVHRMMPPKMFTSTARTWASDRRIRNASVTWWTLAPPPTSRKLAGRRQRLLVGGNTQGIDLDQAAPAHEKPPAGFSQNPPRPPRGRGGKGKP